MKKAIITCICSLVMLSSVQSQDFDSAVGLRLGYPLSVTYKKFVSETNAIEAYAGYRNWIGASFLSLAGGYQIHKDLEIDDLDGLQWYYGGGASVYFWTFDFSGGSRTSFGLQGYIGVSYTLEETPINVSIDWIPTLFINGADGFGNGFGGGYGSIGVRYVLGRDDSDE